MSGLFGIGDRARQQILERALSRRSTAAAQAKPAPGGIQTRRRLGDPKRYEEIRLIREASQRLQLGNPFFMVHDARAADTTSIGNRELLNFTTYNYCGLNGDPRVSAAAAAAIERYGTSVGASRLVAGERPIHGDLERKLAEHYGTEDCIAMVSGHATNVTAIGCLLSSEDLILHDSLAHNSIVQGAILSGARRMAFPHNDMQALDRMLERARAGARQVLIAIEGHYSMDGDVPDLAGAIAIARRHDALLLVDEAHSLGVLGETGKGIAEHLGVDPSGVDVWMGTLSKTLSSCGGYLAGSAELIDYLRYTAPGFVYSVGLSPPLAAAASTSLDLLHAEPWRVAKLRENASLFLAEARAAGLDTGPSIGASIVPVIVGSSIRAARAANLLLERGVNVQPIIHPAVQERAARLRFFLSALHEPAQVREAVRLTAQAVAEARSERLPLSELMRALTSKG